MAIWLNVKGFLMEWDSTAILDKGTEVQSLSRDSLSVWDKTLDRTGRIVWMISSIKLDWFLASKLKTNKVDYINSIHSTPKVGKLQKSQEPWKSMCSIPCHTKAKRSSLKPIIYFRIKVHIFWEGHKILRNLHQLFFLGTIHILRNHIFRIFGPPSPPR